MTVRLIIAISAFAFMMGCSDKEVIFSTNRILNKTPEQVEKILGKPDTAYIQKVVTKSIFTQIYKDVFTVEIMYPKGRATDIVIHDVATRLPFTSKAIKYFGLEELPPSDTLKNGYIKWKNYAGYKTINIFSTALDSGGNVKQFKIFFKSDGAGG